MRSMSDDDLRAFLEAMSDVRPLPPRERPPPAPAPRPTARFSRADEQQVLRESLLPPEDLAVLDTGEELAFRRPWIREDVLKRLRRSSARRQAAELVACASSMARVAARALAARC